MCGVELVSDTTKVPETEVAHSSLRLHCKSDYTDGMKVNADLTKVIGKGLVGKWVALTRDRRKLVDSSDSLPELRAKIGEKRNEYVYMRVLNPDTEYSFSCPTL